MLRVKDFAAAGLLHVTTEESTLTATTSEFPVSPDSRLMSGVAEAPARVGTEHLAGIRIIDLQGFAPREEQYPLQLGQMIKRRVDAAFITAYDYGILAFVIFPVTENTRIARSIPLPETLPAWDLRTRLRHETTTLVRYVPLLSGRNSRPLPERSGGADLFLFLHLQDSGNDAPPCPGKSHNPLTQMLFLKNPRTRIRCDRIQVRLEERIAVKRRCDQAHLLRPTTKRVPI